MHGFGSPNPGLGLCTVPKQSIGSSSWEQSLRCHVPTEGMET